MIEPHEEPPRRVLVYGGTFDPPHRAHVELPRRAADLLGCDRILYVPARINPLKAELPPAPADHRLAMLRLALADDSRIRVCTVELDRAGPSYTVATLEALRAELGPDVELRLLIGADQAEQLHRWHEWRRILELATPAIMLRPPLDACGLRDALAEVHAPEVVDRWMSWAVEVPVIDVSASELRERLARGEDPGPDVPAAVVAYIREHGLYGSSRPPEPVAAAG